MTKDEKDSNNETMLLADAGYDYEPKPRKDGCSMKLWTPS